MANHEEPTEISLPRLIQPPYKIYALIRLGQNKQSRSHFDFSKAVLCLFQPRMKPYYEIELTATTLEKPMFFLVVSIIPLSPTILREPDIIFKRDGNSTSDVLLRNLAIRQKPFFVRQQVAIRISFIRHSSKLHQ